MSLERQVSKTEPESSDTSPDELVNELEDKVPFFEWLRAKTENSVGSRVVASLLTVLWANVANDVVEIAQNQEKIATLLNEGQRIEQKLHNIRVEKFDVRHKIHRLKELFNGYPWFMKRFLEDKHVEEQVLLGESGEAWKELKHFPHFDRFIADWYMRMRGDEGVEGDIIPEQEEAVEEEPQGITISDFVLAHPDADESEGEKQIVFSSEDLSGIFERTYPQGWITTEIKDIQQVSENKPLESSYKIPKEEEWVTLAECSGGWHGGDRADITFYGISMDKAPEEVLLRIGAHEFAHANDWERDNDMSTEERMDLLIAIAERLESDDRYMSDYVEVIGTDTSEDGEEIDARHVKYKKAMEYWAEIVSVYFTEPTTLHVDDYALVDAVVQRHEANYDVLSRNLERRERIMELVRHHGKIADVI